jgi:hypothetical protein
MVIVNVFTKDAEPGQGTTTSVTRIIWGCKYFIYYF